MIVALTLISTLLYLYYYLTKSHNYWKKLGIPYVPALPILGNLKPLVFLKDSAGSFLGSLYNAPQFIGQRFGGIFIWNSEPAVLLRDPELIKQIFVKDFAYFNNRYIECNPSYDPVGYYNLFTIRDEPWKYLRSKLTPAFSSGKMKQMFALIKEVVFELTKHIDNNMKENGGVFEAKELAAKYTTDVICTTAFGIQSNSLNDPEAAFRNFGRKVFHMTFRRSIEVRSFFFMHALTKAFKFYFLQRETCEFFRSVFWDAVETRKKNDIVRNDFLDTLIKLQKESNGDEGKKIFEFDGDSLMAQSVLFFVAGFETTATTISLTLCELSQQQDVQDKLRDEILQCLKKNNGELTYDGLFEMKYLDKCVSETLRKYPPMPFIDRICTKNYKIPDSDVVIKKGTPLFVSMYKGLHYDPKYWSNPEKYDPERFNEEECAKRPAFAYLPFGEGPHICIGMRFGLMNVKTALSIILSKYRVRLSKDIKVPIEIDNRAIILAVKGGLPLIFEPI